MIDSVVRDLRIAARGLRRNPGFAAVAVLTLALGIGATTAVFSVVYGVLLRPLPFPNADRLVQVIQLLPSRGQAERTRAGLTPDQVTEWRATSGTLSQIGYYGQERAAMTGVATPVLLLGSRVTITLFAAVGVPPAIGRTFVPEDEQPGNTEVVILSHRTWAARFGADPGILAAPITLNDRRYRVIGVMPEGFGFPSVASSPSMSLNSDGELDDDPEFWMPVPARQRPTAPRPANAGISLAPTFALLREGVTLEQARAEANALMPARVNERYPIELVSTAAEETRTVRPILLLFQSGVVFVLFIACVNVVNLLRARADNRRHELAIRLSLGASRGQVARHAASEGLLLALTGGVIGSALAYQLVTLFKLLPPYVLPRMDEITVDVTILAFSAGLSTLSGIGVGVASALRALRGDRSDWFGRRGQSIALQSRPHQPSRILVVAEIAAGIVLLASAGLLLTSFARRTAVDPGFEPMGVFTFRVGLPPTRYPDAVLQHGFYADLSSALRQIPGVESVAASSSGAIGFSLTVGGQKISDNVSFGVFAPGFFRTLAIPIRHGRDLADSDRTDRAGVVVVNELFARKYFGSVDPVGHQIGFQDWPGLTVVGVVADSQIAEREEELRPTVYLPQENASAWFRNPVYVVRTSGNATSLLEPVRTIVRSLDPDLVVSEATTMEALFARRFTASRVYGITSGGFAIAAVLLAAIGLYSVLAYSVGSRTREFGIRIALGAQSRTVVASVLRDAMAMVTLGIAAGVAGALYLSRFLETLLFGVTPQDPATLASVALTFVLVAMLACYVPARRATRVDPVVALRAE